MVYERALAIFPTSFKLWKLYVTMRQSFVLGQPTTSALRARKANAGRGSKSKTDVTEMLTFAEAEYEWQGGLDGIVRFRRVEEYDCNWRENDSMAESCEFKLGELLGLVRPLTCLTHVYYSPRHGSCTSLPSSTPNAPLLFQRTFARRTFDRALRSLPPSLHGRIWGLYLRWAAQVGGIVGDRVGGGC